AFGVKLVRTFHQIEPKQPRVRCKGFAVSRRRGDHAAIFPRWNNLPFVSLKFATARAFDRVSSITESSRLVSLRAPAPLSRVFLIHRPACQAFLSEPGRWQSELG